MTRSTRVTLFRRAHSESALVFVNHFPFPGLGRIVADGDTGRWEQATDTVRANA